MLIGSNDAQLKKIKEELNKEFAITDLGIAKFFLIIQILYKSGSMFLSQSHFAVSILEKFKMQNCNATILPYDTSTKLKRNETEYLYKRAKFQQLIGSLYT